MVGSVDSGGTSALTRSDADDSGLAIVGVGNQIMGDDGVGARVVETLEESVLGDREDVIFANAGTTAFFALEAMSGCERAIVIDAIATGADPGTIHQYRFVDGAFAGEIPEMTMHDFSFAEALEAGRNAYDIPDEVLILGVEPARIEMSMELSEPIERTVPHLVEHIQEEVPESPS
ncbi:MAG: hydrogenase maturation protease [Halodesulfurarchaeum sp.]